MKRSYMFVACLALALAVPALAQQGGGGDQGGRGGRGNFDPAQMRERLMNMLKERLGASDEEWKVLQPKLEKVTTAQREARVGGMGGFGGMGGGRPGGEGREARVPENETAMAKASRELRQVVADENATAAMITEKLEAFRAAKKKANEALAEAQKELKELLTPKQEATLVTWGMLE